MISLLKKNVVTDNLYGPLLRISFFLSFFMVYLQPAQRNQLNFALDFQPVLNQMNISSFNPLFFLGQDLTVLWDTFIFTLAFLGLIGFLTPIVLFFLALMLLIKFHFLGLLSISDPLDWFYTYAAFAAVFSSDFRQRSLDDILGIKISLPTFIDFERFCFWILFLSIFSILIQLILSQGGAVFSWPWIEKQLLVSRFSSYFDPHLQQSAEPYINYLLHFPKVRFFFLISFVFGWIAFAYSVFFGAANRLIFHWIYLTFFQLFFAVILGISFFPLAGLSFTFFMLRILSSSTSRGLIFTTKEMIDEQGHCRT